MNNEKYSSRIDFKLVILGRRERRAKTNKQGIVTQFIF